MRRPHRLRSRREIQHVYRGGAGAAGGRRAGRLLALHWRGNDLGRARLAFSVSGKVGGAVRRNLLKRRLRALADQRTGLLEKGLDIVVVAFPPASSASFAELDAEFGELVGRVLGL